MKELNYQDYLRYQELKAKKSKDMYQLKEPDKKYHVSPVVPGFSGDASDI